MKSGLVWFGFALSKDVIGCNVAKDQKGLSHKPGGGGHDRCDPSEGCGCTGAGWGQWGWRREDGCPNKRELYL